MRIIALCLGFREVYFPSGDLKVYGYGGFFRSWGHAILWLAGEVGEVLFTLAAIGGALLFFVLAMAFVVGAIA